MPSYKCEGIVRNRTLAMMTLDKPETRATCSIKSNVLVIMCARGGSVAPIHVYPEDYLNIYHLTFL